VRSQLPTMTLDEGYESKEKMALEIKYPPKLSFSAASICTSSRPIPASASTNHEPEKGDLILLRGLVVVWESKSTEKMALELSTLPSSTPESWKGSPSVHFPSRQWSSEVETVPWYGFEKTTCTKTLQRLEAT